MKRLARQPLLASFFIPHLVAPLLFAGGGRAGAASLSFRTQG